MKIELMEISQEHLTQTEKESILAHAVDLHLLGSDEADHAGFDLIRGTEDRLKHLLRIRSDGHDVGIMYVLPFDNRPDHYEMTILVHDRFRGKHITGDAVSRLEEFVRSAANVPVVLCATVREHHPLRRELTDFLLRHGYSYSPERMTFDKRL